MPLHTQREEDIKSFDEKCNLRVEKGGFLYLYENNDATDTEQIKHFISNIYIKIAENQVKRWTEIFDYHQDMTNENDTYKRNTARVEITYWQEELNKLKS